METAALYTSVDTLTRLGLILLYTPIVLFSYRRLIPRLSTSAKRMASGMLAAQVLIIIVAQFAQPATDFDRWLWDFHEEWNIPATFATLQLATVGGVALLTAWLARSRPTSERFYLLAIGLVFLFLAADEYLAIHEAIPQWESRYIALGVVLVAATVLVALRSQKRSWLWHACLLTGLAISVAGALVINALPITCGSFAFWRFDGCLQFFVLEESFEFLGIWLTLVAVLGHFSGLTPVPSRRAGLILVALPAISLLALFANALAPGLELRLLAQPAAAQFKAELFLRGYIIDQHPGGQAVRLYVSGRQADMLGIGYSIHLVDQASGESVASSDEWADRQHGIWLLGADFAPIYRQRMHIDIPAQAPANRAFWVVLSLWRRKDGGEYKLQKVQSSEQLQLDDRQVVLSELVLPADSPPPSNAPIASFKEGFTLDSAAFPDLAQRGETMDITFAWRSNDEGLNDYSQFLHFIHRESGDWWGYDQAPLGARLPTRLWYSGLADSETWRVPLPADLAPGQYALFSGLYHSGDQARLSASDADGMPWLNGRVALGQLMVE